jgi:hypothetical protein
MRFHVEPDRLEETARPLRHASEVARDLRMAGDNMAQDLAHLGSGSLQQAAGDFLTAWSGGLSGLADQGEHLARMLDLAATSYHGANDEVRSKAANADVGGPA